MIKFLLEAIAIFWVAMGANAILILQWLARRPGIRHIRYRVERRKLEESKAICRALGVKPLMGREFRHLQEIKEGRA